MQVDSKKSYGTSRVSLRTKPFQSNVYSGYAPCLGILIKLMRLPAAIRLHGILRPSSIISCQPPSSKDAIVYRKPNLNYHNFGYNFLMNLISSNVFGTLVIKFSMEKLQKSRNPSMLRWALKPLHWYKLLGIQAAEVRQKLSA